MLGNIKHHINTSISRINGNYYYIKLTIAVFIQRFTLGKNMKICLLIDFFFFKQGLYASPVSAP